MARQAALTVGPLKERLDPVYWGDPNDATAPVRRIRNHPGPNRHPGDGYARWANMLIGDVRSLVVHETSGWPSRNKSQSYVDNYGTPGADVTGPNAAIWGDGTVTPLLEYTDIAAHASFVNKWAIGVETGHWNSRDGYFIRSLNRQFDWHGLSADDHDLTGRKYMVIEQVADTPSEVVAAWFPGVGYTGPIRVPLARGAAPTGMQAGMLFTEAQYRSWALLTRYLAEAYLIPRNFPLLPHAAASDAIRDAATFRRIVMADENVDAIRKLLTDVNLAPHRFADSDFTPGNEASFDANYLANVTPRNSTIPGWNFVSGGTTLQINKLLNKAWLWFFKAYRGVHGHAFCGTPEEHYNDHDCPGPLFDWHRFAREVWDWWWYPFDLDDAQPPHTNTPIRDYRAATGTTPLREYYFHQPAANVAARAAAFGGIQGPTSAPTTYTLDPDSPVHAMANGEIVAARFPVANAGVADMGFVLVKHEIYHRLDTNSVLPLAAAVAGAPPPAPQPTGRIDYNRAPTTVYSLTMHLARPAGLTFTDISDANPEWLNRLIIRRKECDLAFPPPAPSPMNATLAAVPVAEFSVPPPGVSRPTLTRAYQQDQLSISPFLDALERGDIALSPSRQACQVAGQTPIQMILGDYMGRGGTVRREANGALTKGVRVEVFSPQPLEGAGFTPFVSANGWSGFGAAPKPMVSYRSEWAGTPDAAASAALQAIGVNPALVSWWDVVALAQSLDDQMPATDRLPLNGQVTHYAPATFMAWLNDATWSSEWPKYQVKDADHPTQPAARPAAPRSRWG